MELLNNIFGITGGIITTGGFLYGIIYFAVKQVVQKCAASKEEVASLKEDVASLRSEVASLRSEVAFLTNQSANVKTSSDQTFAFLLGQNLQALHNNYGNPLQTSEHSETSGQWSSPSQKLVQKQDSPS